MAKKGGVSEINGFVSVKNEDFKSTSKKTVPRTVPENLKKTPSTSKKTNRGDSTDALKIKRPDPKPTLGTGSKATKSNENSQTILKRTVSKDVSSVGSPRVSKTNSSGTTNVPSRTKTVQNVPNASLSPRKPIEGPAKTKPGIGQKKDAATLKNNVVQRKSTSSTSSSSKVILSKSKTIENPTKREAPQSNKTVSRSSVSPAQIKSTSKTSGSSHKSKPSSNSSGQNTSNVKLTKDVTVLKISSKEKTNIKIQDEKKDPWIGNEETEIKITDTYKDLIYFEVDMGNTKEGKKPVSDEKSVSVAPLSRQGTFVKESSDEEDRPDLPKEASSPSLDPSQSDQYDYEDDFEDYESDFEEYLSESGVSSDSDGEIHLKVPPQVTRTEEVTKKTAALKTTEKRVEEERKLDSGSYDLTTKSVSFVLPPSVKQKQLDQIMEAITQENTMYLERDTLPKRPSTGETGREAIDFVGALERQGAESARKEKKHRSTLILEKIKLHEQAISIFEEHFFLLDNLDPIYKDRNVAHVSCEASLGIRHVEIQTDFIRTQEKWVQFPPKFHTWSDSTNPLEEFLKDRRGYGGDEVAVDVDNWLSSYYNPEKLYNFIESAGQVMLILIEEEERMKSEGNISVTKSKHDHGFSTGFIPIQTKGVDFLKNRPICDLIFSPHNENIFISSHRCVKNPENLTTFEDQFYGRSILCLWNILEPSLPLAMLVASAQLSALAFDIVHFNLIYGGLTDGSVCLWDTGERSLHHKETIAGSLEHLLRTPSYCSSYLLSEDLHSNVIVTVLSLGYDFKGNHSPGKFIPTEVLTLDSDGKIILWITVQTPSCLDSEFTLDKEDFGQTFWSRYKLVASRALSPADHLPAAQKSWSLQLLCLSLAPQSSGGVLVGTNTGSVVHCLLSEEKPSVPVYSHKEETDCITSVNAVERSPHLLPVFLAGCSNGTVRIHLMERKRPLRVLLMEGLTGSSPVCRLLWCPRGVGHFFVLDKNSSLYVWDLCQTEFSPLISLPLKKMKATHFDISADKKSIYVALVVHKERIEIHRLKEQFSPRGLQDPAREKEIFLSFIDKCCY